METETDSGDRREEKFELECGYCRHRQPARPRSTVCPECGKPFLVRYRERETDLRELTSGGRGMWRFRELLPLRDGEEPVTLLEGDTPCLPVPTVGEDLGVDLYVKDEGRNPTGSFKDRGLSAAVTRAAADGVPGLVIPSAGNAGAALSAYGARAGLPVRVYIPEDTPEGVERRCRRFGSDVVTVDGLITDCGDLAAEYAEETGAFNVSTLQEPYRIEGKKTMMLEIVEALGGPPDAMVYPTGGGTGLIASWKVLNELEELGVIDDAHTRLYSVQSEGCAPIVRAWREGREEAETWTDAETDAFGLRVPSALGDFLILRALRQSGGGAVAVPDREMEDAADELGAREGVNAVIEGGGTLAAARRLRASGEIEAGESVVLFNTANLLVY
ncbi:MAG: threonine synthase [Candidatus Palauibacterales bacterium]|nr:threonine synthase [Candidatus Palauibacterales bacterium]